MGHGVQSQLPGHFGKLALTSNLIPLYIFYLAASLS